MSNILKYDHFIINERHHVNQDVRHLTNLIYNKINYYLSKLILNKEIVLTNFLQDNYKNIKFKNDKIVLKLGNKHGGVKSISMKDDTIEDLILELTIKLSPNEIKNKYLINNRVRETINHECQHIVEFEKRKGKLSGSWNFNKRLKSFEYNLNGFCNKYNIDSSKWFDITHYFYLCEEHEIRSSVSQMLEYIKNNNTNNINIENLIKSSDIYEKYDVISKIKSADLINDISKSNHFNDILNDFIKSVIMNKSQNTIYVFEKEINSLKKRANDCKYKLLSISKNFINEYFSSNDIDRDIDWSDYITNPLVEMRDKKINMILNESAYFAEIGDILPESDIYIYVQKLHRNEEDFIDGDISERIEEYSKYKLELIKISDIDIDEWDLDDDKVKEYEEEYKNKQDYPPIVIGDKNNISCMRYKNGKYVYQHTIIDGTHRVNALYNLGINKVKAWVGIK